MLFGKGWEGQHDSMQVAKIQFVCVRSATNLNAIKLSPRVWRIQKQLKKDWGNEFVIEANESYAYKQTKFSISVNQDCLSQCTYSSNQNISSARVTPFIE